MSKSAKTWLIAAAFLVVIGMVIIAIVMAFHWDLADLSKEEYETNTYEISEKFQNIKINAGTEDILFAVSENNTSRVVCFEDEKMKHTVGVHNGTLTITAEDNREWHDYIGINLQSAKITVFLPKTEYDAIVIDASTGDIVIPDEIIAESVNISLSTGDITIKNISADSLELSTSTGGIAVSGVTCTGDIKADVTTGDVEVMNVMCQNLLSSGSTSEISLRNVIASGKISIERSTGDVIFEDSDSAEIYVKTSTGDVSGSLLTEKVFITDTSTGDVSVPKTAAGGKCEIRTSTGDIRIRISGGDK